MILASIATYKPRIKDVIWDAVESLSSQVDMVFINLNTHPELTEEEIASVRHKMKSYKNVVLKLIEKDYGDLSKFTQLIEDHPNSEHTHFICDDDLVYPKDYVSSSMKLLDRLNTPLSYGGKKLKNPPYKNFRGSFKTWSHVLKGSLNEHTIDLPLTCVTVLRRNMVHQNIKIDAKYKNKGDVLFAKWAKESGVNINCPKFEGNYFKYNDKMKGKNTIWDDMVQNSSVEKDLAELLTDLHRTQKQ